jgi:hypothetical protein
MSLKKTKKTQANPGKSPKRGLVSKTCNSWISRLGLNQEVQFVTNLMLNDEIR